MLNEIDSNFKHDLQEIYNECYFNNAKRNTETSSTTDQTTKAGQLWLAGLLKSVLPTIPIWSNLLVGKYQNFPITNYLYEFVLSY